MDESELKAAMQLPLLSALTPAVASKVLSGAVVRTLPAGMLLFEEGEPPEFLYLLLSGIVEVSRLEGGRDCGVMMFTGGDIFMPAAALFDEPYLVSARTLAPSRLVLLPAAVLRQEVLTEAALAVQLCRLVSGQWRMAVRHILDLKSRSAPQRLGAFLLRIADDSPDGKAAELPIPKRHLAGRLGMTPETLSRTLQLLADNGLHLRGKRIIINDRQKIERFCGPDPYLDRAETSLGVHAL